MSWEDDLVEQLRSVGCSLRAALAMVGLSRSAWHYRHHPRPRVSAGSVSVGIGQRDRVQPASLTAAERQQVLGLVTAGWAGGRSVYESFHDALDAGTPVASLSSWYRLARTLPGPRPARPRRTRRAQAMPQWQADGPNQVWCWDITKLPGRYRSQFYEQYTIIDAFSRKVVATRVEAVESDAMAVELFQQAAASEGTQPRIVHSDRGSAMTSVLLRDYHRRCGITQTRNRPRVSNDNPFAETFFKTQKYRPDWPGHFDSLDHARAWAAATTTDYNTSHHHSSLAGFTPDQVHTGTWTTLHTQRQTTLDHLAAQHPDRYRGQPHAPTPPQAVELNPERLTTG